MLAAVLTLRAALICAAFAAAWYARNRVPEDGVEPRGRTERMIAEVLVPPTDADGLSGPGNSVCASR